MAIIILEKIKEKLENWGRINGQVSEKKIYKQLKRGVVGVRGINKQTSNKSASALYDF